MLTAAHVIEGAVSVRVRFDADLPGEWITGMISCWTDPRSDLAVLTIVPHEGEPPPERDSDPVTSPWEGMSGAAGWVGDRIVGVIAKHHRSDGLGRLAATRLDLALEGLDASRRAELRALIGLPDVLPDVGRVAPHSFMPAWRPHRGHGD